ncbi:DUF4440 domain-containing protein [Haliangium sp.]|uniref:DUF4440 domain-containing protein n=1 Tax=Haliangium sp. TaxID=2663208 RepID=UPI003D14BC10
MPAEDQTQIDRLATEFFAIFDNRRPGQDFERLRDLVLPQARITQIVDGGPKELTLDQFLLPRARLLTDGSLIDFHEWELDATTHILGHAAARISRYQKQGRLNGADYSGTGTKVFQLVRTQRGWRIHALLWEDQAH